MSFWDVMFISLGLVLVISLLSYWFFRSRKNRMEQKKIEQQREKERILEDRTTNFNRSFKDISTLELNEWVSEPLKRKFEQAYDKKTMLKMHLHFLEENPGYAYQYKNVWIELNRFFFLAGIFKNVEMFSSTVDSLWHSMLDCEKEYELFCRRFINRKIDHLPHSNDGVKVSKPKERALFDIMYVMFFPISEPSTKLWGDFLEKDRNEHTMYWFKHFKETPIEQLKKELLLPDTSPQAVELFVQFVDKVKKELHFDKAEALSHKTWHNYVESPEVVAGGIDFSKSILTRMHVFMFAAEWFDVESEEKTTSKWEQEQMSRSGTESSSGRSSSHDYSWTPSSSKSSDDSGSSSTYSSCSSGSDSSCSSGSSSSCSSGGGSSSSCSSCSS